MPSFFKKLFSKKIEDQAVNLNSEIKFEIKGELDFIFVENFTESGGYFNYEESLSNGLQKLKEIFYTLHSDNVFCLDLDLQQKLQTLKIPYSENAIEKQDVFVCPCEYLVAFDGSIMFSADQIKSYKINELPKNIIIWAHPYQIVENKSVGLEKIRREKKDQIPNNITSICGKKSQTFLKQEYIKELYLLLIEPIK